MKRDFSEEKVTELWEFVESCTKDMISRTTGYLEASGLDGDLLEAVIALEAVDHFLEQMEEKEIITARKLEQIIADVKEVDKTYGGYLKTLNDQLDAYDCKVRSVAEMLKPEKLSMNPADYQKEIQAISSAYSEAKENSEMLKVELWIKPGYRLSEEELKEAQEILDKYFVEGSLQQLMRDENCPVDGEKSIADWTVEEKLKYDKMMELYAKADIKISTFRGIYEGIPFMKQMEDGMSGWNAHIWGYDLGEGFDCGNAFANSHTQHPYATLGGNIIGSLLTYNAAAEVARGIPGLSERISGLSGRLSTFPILRSIGQDHISNIIGATLVDTGVFTLPGAIEDVIDGESAGNVFRNAGLDIGQNLLFNIGGEAISSAVGKVLKVGSGKSGSNFKGQLYNGTRNPDVDFVNGKGKSTLNKHAGKHGYTSPGEYLKDARNFLEKKPTSTIQSFISNEGTYFRYDTATNEFGIINEYGGISTYFKPENGMAYWLEQIEKYAPK